MGKVIVRGGVLEMPMLLLLMSAGGSGDWGVGAMPISDSY